MLSKFPIGSRVGAKVTMSRESGIPVSHDVPMRVLGYEGIKFVIAEALEDRGHWKKGKVAVVPVDGLTLREEVKHIPGEAQDGEGPAIGWMELGGLSVALTRDRNGKLLIAIEKSPDAAEDLFPIPVRFSRNDGESDLWEGEVS